MDRTAQAARPPLVGVVWGGSSRATIYPLRPPKHGLRARSPECRLRSPKVVDMEQGAVQRYGVLFQITGDGLRDNFLHPLPGENRRRANPPLSHPCSTKGARRRSPTTTGPLGTPTTALVRTLSIVLVNQGSIAARLLCVFAEPNHARDARTAAPSRLPITDHLPSLYAPFVVRSGEQRAWDVGCGGIGRG